MDVEVGNLVGPKGQHDLDRTANLHGTELGTVNLGGQRVPVRGPRVRTVASDDESEHQVAFEA